MLLRGGFVATNVTDIITFILYQNKIIILKQKCFVKSFYLFPKTLACFENNVKTLFRGTHNQCYDNCCGMVLLLTLIISSNEYIAADRVTDGAVLELHFSSAFILPQMRNIPSCNSIVFCYKYYKSHQ